jgi:hypothetical protein
MSPSLARYATAYNKAYAATARRAPQLFWSNGHPNGAYLARTVAETFGIDSLMPAVADPFALIRVYREALAKRGTPDPFSVKAAAVLDSLHAVYGPVK